MTLGEAQRKFTLLVGKLIIHAYDIGLEMTQGEGYDDDNTGHMKGSLHYIRLAQDFNVFKDGKWLDKGADMEFWLNKLHDYWDLLGGAKRIKKDLNHFSYAWQGKI
jgi:hypothetical protein